MLKVNFTNAEELKLTTGSQVKLSSVVAEAEVVIEVAEKISKGVVSLPHGFIGDGGILQDMTRSGVNYKRLASSSSMDVPSATPAWNAIPVTDTTLSN